MAEYNEQQQKLTIKHEMHSLIQDAWYKVSQGQTAVYEVLQTLDQQVLGKKTSLC